MSLHPYTTVDDVRAALGVSSEELEDVTLELETISTQLVGFLEDLDSNLPTQFETIDTMQQNTRTTAQQKFYLVTRAYATYVVAGLMLSTLAMFSFKRITDGKAEAERSEAWDTVKQDIKDNLEILRRRVQSAYTALNTTYSAPAPTRVNFIVAAGLATNPVTGE